MHRGILEIVFCAGVHGSVENIRQWVQMYRQLAAEPLPNNLAEFQASLDQQVAGIEQFAGIELTDDLVQKEVMRLFDAGATEVILPYSELRWRNHAEWVFHTRNKEQFFVSNNMQLSPLQYIRSRVQNFCDSKGVIESHRDEIVISVTEAAENAIKYSNVIPVFIEHGIEKDEYFIRAINSVNDLNLNDEISRGKFSEDVSLMRGVLVMSKLLDYLDIARDVDKKRVEFVGRKKVQFKSARLVLS
jgi:anti-sigma regulatory factor (Ser/Thr protein kinase)